VNVNENHKNAVHPQRCPSLLELQAIRTGVFNVGAPVAP